MLLTRFLQTITKTITEEVIPFLHDNKRTQLFGKSVTIPRVSPTVFSKKFRVSTDTKTAPEGRGPLLEEFSDDFPRTGCPLLFATMTNPLS